MADWRDDPDWRLASLDLAWWEGLAVPGNRPAPRAELAQPPVWASLYEKGRPVATWHRLDGRLQGPASNAVRR